MINKEVWLAAVKEANQITDDPEAVTTRELCAVLGLSERAVQRRINSMIDQGKARLVGRKVVLDSFGRRQFAPAYVLVPCPAPAGGSPEEPHKEP